MELINFDECLRPPLFSQKHYGGLSGNKEHILINNENYFLKYPKKFSNGAKNYTNVILSYSNSPLSEYIASHIYEMLEIPVHKTLLGVSKEKRHVLVACKDFLEKGEILDEFKQIKVSYAPSFEENEDTSGSGCNLKNVLKIISENPFLQTVEGVEERFWNMFVIDAFIGNSDRNNGNWGIIRSPSGHNRLSPVYDNGNSFNNKWDEKKFEKFLFNKEDFKRESYIGKVCIFTETGKDGEEHPINPFKIIVNKEYEKLSNAIIEVIPRIYKKKDEIVDFINDIPNEFMGINVISSVQKKFYCEILRSRYNDVLLPVYNNLKNPSLPLEIKFKSNIEISHNKNIENKWFSRS